MQDQAFVFFVYFSFYIKLGLRDLITPKNIIWIINIKIKIITNNSFKTEPERFSIDEIITKNVIPKEGIMTAIIM